MYKMIKSPSVTLVRSCVEQYIGVGNAYFNSIHSMYGSSQQPLRIASACSVEDAEDVYIKLKAGEKYVRQESREPFSSAKSSDYGFVDVKAMQEHLAGQGAYVVNMVLETDVYNDAKSIQVPIKAGFTASFLLKRGGRLCICIHGLYIVPVEETDSFEVQLIDYVKVSNENIETTYYKSVSTWPNVFGNNIEADYSYKDLTKSYLQLPDVLPDVKQFNEQYISSLVSNPSISERLQMHKNSMNIYDVV